jgi:hypothetical protein
MLNRCQCLCLILSFPLLLASFYFCFRLLHAYELVEDDVGEETIAQTSTAEQSGPLWTKWPVSMAPLTSCIKRVTSSEYVTSM